MISQRPVDVPVETVVSSPVTSDQPAESSDLRWVPSEQLLNRELAWLRFNSRVLAIAEDEHTPLLERAKFLAIVGSNMDEFFMKRIGGLKLRIRMGIETLSADGLTPRQGLAACRPLISEITTRQSTCFTETLVPLLRDRGINFSAWSEIDAEMKKWCRAFFLESIDPVLTPLAVDASHPFPFISNLSLSLAVRLQEADGPTRFVRVKVPRNRARWVRLPDGVTYVPLEEVIANSIDLLFPGEELFGVHMFRVTRSIVVDTGDYQDDLYQDMGERPGQLRREIVDELRERRFAPAVRLEVDEEMPEDLRQWLLDQLHLLRDDLYQKSGPIGLADLVSLLDIDRPDLKYPAWRPRVHPRLKGLTTTGGGDGQANIFAMIRQGDLLLHHPFHDFDSSVLHFIRSAAEDPKVLAIKQTLYRTTRDSPVVHALVRAAECDKQVAVLVELKARLDENQNLRWAQVLESAGAHVSYGVEDLKTHTKIVLVVREEETGLRRYAHIGTGNYHPGTARLYTDMGLMTADPEVCEDVAHLFNMLTGYSRYGRYKKLLVAPKTMRKQFLGLIQREIEHARLGRKGEIVAKMNQLEDPKIIGKLYEASQAGVEVHLIVRGFCILRPGVPGLSDRIRVKSVVGRFLEHERLYMFGNAGKPEYYIGSADWMARNLSHRVEAIVRVDDPNCRAEIDKVLRVYLDDPYAWKMKPDGVYTRKTVVDGELPRGAQEVLMLLHADLDEE